MCSFGGIFYMIVMQSNKSIVYDTLTPRAKEYIREQKKKDSVPWVVLDVDTGNTEKKPEIIKNKTFTTPCFKYIIPFAVYRIRHQGKCFEIYSLLNPRGTVTIYQQKSQVMSLKEDPAIIMRRSKPNEYTEKTVDVNGYNFIIFTKVQAGSFEETAFRSDSKSFFVLNIETNTAEGVQENYMNIIETITFN